MNAKLDDPVKCGQFGPKLSLWGIDFSQAVCKSCSLSWEWQTRACVVGSIQTFTVPQKQEIRFLQQGSLKNNKNTWP